MVPVSAPDRTSAEPDLVIVTDVPVETVPNPLKVVAPVAVKVREVEPDDTSTLTLLDMPVAAVTVVPV